MSTDPAPSPVADPKAQLERALRDEYLHALGHDQASLDALPPERRLDILRELSRRVAVALAEVDARASYVHQIHGASGHE